MACGGTQVAETVLGQAASAIHQAETVPHRAEGSEGNEFKDSKMKYTNGNACWKPETVLHRAETESTRQNRLACGRTQVAETVLGRSDAVLCR
jgi:hypothetical protein